MDFRDLTPPEADALAAAWLATADDRLQWLQLNWPDVSLTLTDSEFASLLRRLAAECRVGPHAPDATLPVWFSLTRCAEFADLSVDSLWLVDAAALYLGELLIARDPRRLMWGAHVSDRPRDPWTGQPAVLGYRLPYSTLEDMGLYAARAARGRPEPPNHVVAGINCYLDVFASS